LARKSDIRLRRSAVSGSVPGGADLNLGELALNTADGAIFVKNGAGNIVTVSHDGILHYDEANSRIGIGTTNPSSTFQVEGTGDYLANFKSSDAASGIKLTNSSSQSRVVNISGHLVLVADANNNNSNSTIRFNIDTASVAASDSSMILTSTGLGIGTSSPGAKLQVDGAIVSEGGSFTSGQETFADAGLIIQKNDYIYSDDNDYLRRIIGHSSTGILEIGQGGTALITDITLKPGSTGNIRFFSSGSEDVRINSSGDMGVGTTTPQGKLVVSNSGAEGIEFFPGNFTNGNTIQHYNRSTNAYVSIKQIAADYRFNIGTAEKVRIDTIGRLLVTDNGYNAQFGNNIGGNSDKFVAVSSATAGQTVAYHLGVNDTARNSRVKLFMTDDAVTANRAFGIAQTWSSGGAMPFILTMGSNERLKVSTTGAVTFNNAFTFPTAIGSAGQILKVPATGTTLVWGADAGGGSATLLTDSDGDTLIQVEESTDEDVIRFDVAGSEVAQMTDDGVVLNDGYNFEGDVIGAIKFKAQAGEALTKGDTVYISGISGNTTIVSKADANDAAKMPAFGLAASTVSLNAAVQIVTFGTLQGIDTSSYSEGDELYVNVLAGTLTDSAPTGSSSAVQKIAKVTRSDANAGSVKVSGAGRINATPNLDEGKIFVGNASNKSVQGDDTLHVDMANSRVGINKAAPLDALHVTGVIRTQLDGDNNKHIRLFGGNSGNFLDSYGNTLYIRPSGNTATATTMDASGNVGIGANLTVAGNLTVNGTQTILNTATLSVDDLNITVADGAADAAAANGAGLTVDGANATLTYTSAEDRWNFNKKLYVPDNIRIAAGGPSLILQDTTDDDDHSIRFMDGGGTNRMSITTLGDNLNFETTGSRNFTFMGDTTNYGNVGIGTASPDHKLEISTDMGTSPTSVIFLRQTGTNQTGGGGAIRFDTSASNNDYTKHYASVEGVRSSTGDGSNTLLFKTSKATVNSGAPATKMVIDEDGNVGINTSSPSAKLDVEGGDLGGTTGNTTTAAIFRAGRQNLVLQDKRTATGTDWNNATFKMIAQIDTTDHQSIDFVNDSSFNEHIDIRTGNQVFNTRFQHDGKVGIGTTSPAQKLHVNGSGRFRSAASGLGSFIAIGNQTETAGNYSAYYFGNTSNDTGYFKGGIAYETLSTTHGRGDMHFLQRSDTGGGNADISHSVMTILNSGSVGIGTSSPTSKVHISGTSDGSGSGADAMLHVKQNGSWNGNEPWALYVEGYSYLNGFRINAGDGIRSLYKTTSGGSLGFATSDTAPITFTQSNSAEKMRIHSNGFVGIGTTTPKAKLQVEEYGIDTTTSSTTATTQVAIHTFPIADFRSARFTIQITNTTDSTYHSTEILAIHDGTTANITEFGEVHTGSSVEATFDADINTGNFRLLATPASTNTMAFKVVCHSLTV